MAESIGTETVGAPGWVAALIAAATVAVPMIVSVLIVWR